MRNQIVHQFDYSSKLIRRSIAIKQIGRNYNYSMKFLSSNKYNFNDSSSPEAASASFISEKLRNAQASEIFRSNYYQSKNSDSFIPVNDLDQLIVQERVRPSILLDIYAITGHGLGLISRFSPKTCQNMLTSIIDESTTQQFNDSIRSMQLHEVINYDIKETLKYHRDLNSNGGSESSNTRSTDNNDVNASVSSSSVDNSAHANDTNNDDMNLNVKTVLTTVVYHMLKVSEKY
jgi:demethoxyubiquinone hydroxylase (CLK1/Coq7/Cat5 family)